MKTKSTAPPKADAPVTPAAFSHPTQAFASAAAPTRHRAGHAYGRVAVQAHAVPGGGHVVQAQGDEKKQSWGDFFRSKISSMSSGTRHDYSTRTHVMDLPSGMEEDEALEKGYQSLRHHAAPGGHGTKVSEDGTELSVPILGSVTSTANSQNRSVTNQTNPGRHLLHSGYVERKPVVEDGKMYIQSTGGGTGIFPRMNSLFARPLWSGVDQEVRYDLNPGLKEKEQQARFDNLMKQMEDYQ